MQIHPKGTRMHTSSSIGAAEALELLRAGNARFTAGKCEHPHQDPPRRQALLSGQHPIAAVLSCSDSRAPVELIFDQGFGDLFVIRNAGNVVDDVVLASIEYAVEHLGVNLVLVLGHTQCGAVTAAMTGGQPEGHLGSILELIQPAVLAAADKPGDRVYNAALENTRRMAHIIRSSQQLAAHTTLSVASAMLHLDGGSVELGVSG